MGILINSKKIVFLVYVLFFVKTAVFSQENIETEKILNQHFSKIDPKSYINLIPFFENEKWGYINRFSKKVVVPAMFSRLGFFCPDMDGYYKNNNFTVSSTGKLTINKKEISYTFIREGEDRDDSGVEIINKNGYNGFTLDSNGKLIAYSSKYEYNKQHIPGWNLRPFMHKGKHYAVANNLQGKWGIIDSAGQILPGFDFKYQNIMYNKNTVDPNNIWLFVKGENKYWSLINTKGQIKFKDEIIFYPFTSQTVFGLTPMVDADISGIFDTYNMKWLISPQTKVKIGEIVFSSNKHLDGGNPLNRNLANIYYEVFEGKSAYYPDLKSMKYISIPSKALKR